MRVRTGMIAVAVIATGLTGCATPTVASSSAPVVSASPTITEVKVPKVYVSINELRTDVETKTSLTCTDWEMIPTPIGANARATCTSSTVLSLYDTRTEARESAQTVGEMVAGIMGDVSIHVIGDTWSVNVGSDSTLALEIANALGGEVIKITQ